jgi:hypothetical protein
VRERPVLVQGRVGLDLGSDQRDAPKFDQPGIFTEQKDLGKKVFQSRSMLLPEPGNGSVVQKNLGRDHPIGDIQRDRRSGLLSLLDRLNGFSLFSQ